MLSNKIAGLQRSQSRWGLWISLACLACLCLLVSVSSPLQAAGQLTGFRMVQQNHVMLHFDLDSDNATVDMFALSNPDRLVIDLPKVTLATEMPTETFPQGVVSRIRYAQHDDEYLRVVLDLREKIEPESQFVPRKGGQRLVIDLGVKGDESSLPAGAYRSAETAPLRDAVVAIDAGHGGKDPGALGQKKTLEKDVTLAVAKKLYERLKIIPGITPVLVRDKDIYIKLRERMNIARKHGADLFVSIHADAVERREAKGGSVYTLSLDGASSEAAAWLARSENESAALYGDVALEDMENGIRETILNLTQGATMEMSRAAGADVLKELEKIGNVHKRSVEQAGFAVLKSPDIPSILVETAFISNLEEEKKLNSARYQESLARAIEQGIISYFAKRAPAGTHLAAERRRNGS